ncbi:MAG: hypothetical protein ABSB69_18085 [Solirubrobacteraceae bacterium]
MVPMVEQHQVALKEVTPAKEPDRQVLAEHDDWEKHLLSNDFDLETLRKDVPNRALCVGNTDFDLLAVSLKLDPKQLGPLVGERRLISSAVDECARRRHLAAVAAQQGDRQCGAKNRNVPRGYIARGEVGKLPDRAGTVSCSD